MTLVRNNRGQISIFFSASLVVLVSIIAFVINVGLFVKAKINLQNATDAAAFAGAAVQSRQLTKIAYLNWEMRNIFKEWMYKYYVVGSLNVPMVEDPSKATGNKMDFRLADNVNAITGSASKDPYNFPAVCIHIAGSQTNVCKRFGVPGLPEFGSYNMPGAEEASRSFIDVLIGEKINDCVERSKLNMLATTSWAYNVLSSDTNTLTNRGPAILADRQGAWPKAVELAMRIRNLEKVMNRRAVESGVCRGSGGGNCTAITEIEGQNFLGNERIVKAFYSGWRNLGNHVDNEMKNTFTIREIPPKLPDAGTIYSNSNLLIPTPYQKQFVDLKLMMINYATFYAALIPRADSLTSGACDISKVAIPVPGYPLGFYKNPDVLTYYAVRGEAEFEGMFNPFNTDKIKLTAYAAAKPFGGRIGPMLFTQKPGQDAIKTRGDANKFRSVPYISSLNVVGTINEFIAGTDKRLKEGQYAPGAPLPVNLANRFWIKDSDSPIGGLSTNDDVQFGVPNLVYDFLGDMSANSYTDQGSKLFVIDSSQGYNGDKAVGLFNLDQFKAFRGNISGNVSPDMLLGQIARVRAATNYETANYLIPTPYEFNTRPDIGVDSFGFSGGATKTPIPGIEQHTAHVFAPLFRGNSNQEDLLYNTSSEVKNAIFTFMRQQQSGIDNYTQALNKAAIEVYAMKDRMTGAAAGSIPRYLAAARKLSDIDVTSTQTDYFRTAKPESCNSLSGQFLYFYYGHQDLFRPVMKDYSTCPTTLGSLLEEYFSAAPSDPSFATHYKMEYSIDTTRFSGQKKYGIFSAYMPGTYNGIGEDGVLSPPFPGLDSEVMRRNFYSTKFVPLDSLHESGMYNENKNFVIYSEGGLTTSPGFDRSQSNFTNSLDTDELGIDLSAIKY